MRIALAVLILALLVVAHEWGHFITALKIGVPVEEFSVGFGPVLFSKKRGKVRYSLRAVPLGGFVRMTFEYDGFYNPEGFMNRKPWEKILIAAAGPIMNFVVAVLLFVLIFSVIGMPEALDEPRIGEIIEGSAAQKAGLQAGDYCSAVNGETVVTWSDFTGKISAAAPGEILRLRIERGTEQLEVELSPVYDAEKNRMLIGVYNTVIYNRMNLLQAVPAGLQETWMLTCAMAEGLKIVFTGQASADDISGPIGITQIIGEAAASGMLDLLAFMAFISINLGMLNLLPIPALDGSRILLAVIEGVRGKRLPPEREATLNWVGFMFLIGLMLWATYHDVAKILE